MEFLEEGLYDTILDAIGYANLVLLAFCLWFMLYLLGAKFKRRNFFRFKIIPVVALALLFEGTYIIGAFDTAFFGEFFHGAGLISAIFIIVFLYAYALICLEGPALQKLFWTILAFVFYALGAVAGMLFYFVVESVSVSGIDTHVWSMLQVNVISVIVQGLATSLMVRKQSTQIKLSSLTAILLGTIPLLSCVAIVAIANFGLTHNSSPEIAAFELAVTASIAGINLAAFALYNHMSHMTVTMLDQQRGLQKAQLERVYHAEIDALYKETRSWRHDFRNHIQALNGYALTKNYDELVTYLESIDKSTNQIEFRVNTGIEVLDAIISTKIKLAEEQGIRVKVDITLQSGLALDMVDVTTLVGNLLDNAIEASTKVVKAGHDAVIDVSISNEMSTQLMISVENPMIGKLKEKDGVILTSKTEGDHGIGLGQIDAIVKKYDGFVMRKTEEGSFATYVRIPLT